MVSFSRLLVAASALSLSSLVDTVSADLSSKLDFSTFEKMVAMQAKGNLPGTMIIHIKKKYGYDSKDITEKINMGVRNEPLVTVYDLELAEEDENNEDSNKDDEEFDWKKKEGLEKEMTAKLVSKHNLKRDQVPYLSVMRNGRQVASYKVEEDGEASDALSWVESQGISLIDESEANLPEAIATAITAFGTSANAGTTGEYEKILSDTEAEVAKIEKDSEKEMAAIYVKTLKTVAKKKDVKSYIETEFKRLAGMLASSAITHDKKKEMRNKSACLKALGKKMDSINKAEL